MKCKYKKPDVATYNLAQYVRKHPEFKESLPREIDVTDNQYIVRFCGDFAEIGYESDEWFIS